MISKVELTTKPASFIGAYQSQDASVCDALAAYFHASPQLHRRGAVSRYGAAGEVDHAVKESVDLSIPADSTLPVFRQYTQLLQRCVTAYIADYSYCGHYAPWSLVEGTNIQYHPPGGGFKAWHTERTSGGGVIASRHLVFMTYLNTVADGGETEFFYQALKARPVKGLTLIWPADWTHTHRGVPSPTEEKYVITGWLNYTK